MGALGSESKILNKYPGTILFEETIKSKTSNNAYSIIFFEKHVACTCPAGGKKMLCKHIISCFHQNFELVKNKSEYLFNALIEAIEAKDNKNLSKEEKAEIYKKIIYSNKEISMLSYKNGDLILESDIKEYSELEPILNSDNELAECFFSFLKSLQDDPYGIYIAKPCDSIKELIKLGYLTKLDDKTRSEDLVFMGNEILYTNKPIYKLANSKKQCEITSSNSKIKKIGANYSIELK